jgi:hypothetical protein
VPWCLSGRIEKVLPQNAQNSSLRLKPGQAGKVQAGKVIAMIRFYLFKPGGM